MRIWLLVVLAACHSGSNPVGGDDYDGPVFVPVSPPVNAKADYQLGGSYTPSSGVTIVSRDRTEPPANGMYNICYINGFQIQHTPDEEAYWMNNQADLILMSGGSPVIDQDWNEMLLDTSTAEKRSRVAVVVSNWIEGCWNAGYNAVEIDNLDSYTRSKGLLTEDNNVAVMSLLSAKAHVRGLAIAQKNSAELVPRRAELGTDFAVAEECNHYNECDSYTAGYGDHVIVIEYERADFTTGCSAFPNLSIILRDRDLVTPTDAAYVYDGC